VGRPVLRVSYCPVGMSHPGPSAVEITLSGPERAELVHRTEVPTAAGHRGRCASRIGAGYRQMDGDRTPEPFLISEQE